MLCTQRETTQRVAVLSDRLHDIHMHTNVVSARICELHSGMLALQASCAAAADTLERSPRGLSIDRPIVDGHLDVFLRTSPYPTPPPHKMSNNLL